MRNIILASKSPRRKELLTLLNIPFTIQASHVDESFSSTLKPYEAAMYLSRIKAEAIYEKNRDSLIIGADTIVFCEDEYLEKPIDEKDAFRMLSKLSGKTHQVITGVTICFQESIESFYSKTDVTFYNISNDEINRYIETKEPFDKAGAYGIQGYASLFVKEIKGDYFTVVGLPIGQLNQALKKYQL